MADIVVIGGGIAGLTGALLLARDGHQVTVLEHDPAPPCSPDEAWATWERRGVGQFRLPHGFLPRFRALIDAELPDVAAALEAAGALRYNRIKDVPESITGGWRDGDERFEALTGRRPMMEATIAAVAAREPGVDVRRGVAVRGVTADHTGAVPHVTGVVTDAGDVIAADLIVDAGGRRSALPDLLAAAGIRRPVEERAESGFRVLRPALPIGRRRDAPHVRAAVAALRLGDADHAAGGQRHVVGHRDGERRGRRDAPRPPRRRLGARRAQLPADRPLDRRRADHRGQGDGEDRGSHPALHAVALRDALRKVGADDARDLIRQFDELTATVVEPFVGDTLRFDRHRLAEIDAQIAGVPYETDDPGWNLGRALAAAAPRDPDLLRGAMDIGGLLARGVDVLRRDGLVDKLLAIGPVDPAPGPARAELVDIVGTG